MNLTQLKTEIETLALAVDGIETFTMDWVHTINDNPANEYDMFMLMPIKKSRDIKNRYNDWTLEFYLFRQDKDEDGNSGSNVYRDTVWKELSDEAEEVISTLLNVERQMEDYETVKISALSELVIEPDEDSLGNDDLIWVKGSIRVRTLIDC